MHPGTHRPDPTSAVTLVVRRAPTGGRRARLGRVDAEARLTDPGALSAGAGQAIMGQTLFGAPATELLAPWTGFAVLCADAVVAHAAPAIVITARDSG
jgi:hypothetical protein